MSTSELVWFKSSYSGSQGDACIEMAKGTQAIHVRDSKDQLSPELALSPKAWSSFVSYAAQS
ncbi:DUF397 domain-containing protein [[Kitasatospora] papulosa]|uniref:DUF397 domain-containing protein n=1 Tax=[Kitasatospora] papulosa TaxID=1464011 RepID=UPI00224FE0D7|nr:DUF397 domain-containing protein [[Kitasatospora] papulosa]MCX4412102.1 DUF397 domain-containing protein [[Kitasatospora] papulosa]